MLRGYRGIILALVGVASLGATEPPKPSAHVQQTTKHREPASGANPTRSEQPQEPDKATEPCKAGEDKRFSDLCAQWKAADASKNAADYSFWTIIVSSVGTGLLIWTLWETRETSRRELRAYIMVDSASAILDEGGFKAVIKWLNCGQTPAHDVRVSTMLDISSCPDFKKLPPLHDGNIHMGGGKGFKSQENLSILEFQGRNAAVESVWFYARVTYRDLFKRKRRTDICLEYAGGTEFRAGPCNNIAT
jgi:hypothetical protein